jgi:hypothetical protein
MVSSVDGLAGATAVGSSGAAAASRSCVGGGNRSLGASKPSTLRRTQPREICRPTGFQSAARKGPNRSPTIYVQADPPADARAGTDVHCQL